MNTTQQPATEKGYRQAYAELVKRKRDPRAELIRRAKAYDALVAALTHIAEGDERPGHCNAITKARMAEIACAALAAAKGEA